MKERQAELGDIVAVRWRDHFRFQGDEIPEPLEVISWGKLDFENEDGVGIVQNEVQAGGDRVERRMDSQFVLKPDIIEIKRL